jgi:hypothetical protein
MFHASIFFLWLKWNLTNEWFCILQIIMNELYELNEHSNSGLIQSNINLISMPSLEIHFIFQFLKSLIKFSYMVVFNNFRFKMCISAASIRNTSINMKYGHVDSMLRQCSVNRHRRHIFNKAFWSHRVQQLGHKGAYYASANKRKKRLSLALCSRGAHCKHKRGFFLLIWTRVCVRLRCHPRASYFFVTIGEKSLLTNATCGNIYLISLLV